MENQPNLTLGTERDKPITLSTSHGLGTRRGNRQVPAASDYVKYGAQNG